MSTLKLESCLAEPIRRLIELRQTAGTDYHTQSVLLGYFDRFLVNQRLSDPHLTQQLIESYEKTLLHLAPRVQVNRMCVVRQLCQYLCRSDPLTYVPESFRALTSKDTFVPYIYSDIEIQALLVAAANLPPLAALRGPTYQTLLGLLYSTGLRISEAMHLNLMDFHRNDNRLYVAQGKFRKSRWVPLSDSTLAALSAYVDRRQQTKPCSPDSPLFLNQRGRRLQHRTVCHTFAVHRLLIWYRESGDINARLPWLSTYMGHVNINSTQAYLHPTAELLEQANGRFHRHYLQHITTPGVTP